MYTMRDVARLAEVSIATVSKVANRKEGIRPALVARVEEAMQALNYHPDQVARSLKVRETKTIGMVIADIGSPFWAQMVRGAQDTVWRAGYSLILCDANEDPEKERRHLNTLYSRRVDGVLLASAEPYASLQTNVRAQPPIVLIDRVPDNYQGAAVVAGNLTSSYEVTRYLIDLGHELIALITGRLHLSPGFERAEGYRKAMQETHIPIRQEYLKHGSFRPEIGYKFALELLRENNPPTAIFSANYATTLGLLRALEDSRVKCPEEISIVGFDDFQTGMDGFSLASMFSPKLTTVVQPSYEMGKRAVEMLLDLLSNPIRAAEEKGQHRISLSAKLAIRESCAPPRLQPLVVDLG